MPNDGTNEEKKMKNLEKGIKFSSEYQPSKEARSKGQVKRHRAEEIGEIFIDEVFSKGSFGRAKERVRKLRADDRALDGESAIDVFFSLFIANPKNAERFVDKFIESAKGKVDITSDGEKIQGNSEIINLIDELKAIREKVGEENSERELQE